MENLLQFIENVKYLMSEECANKLYHVDLEGMDLGSFVINFADALLTSDKVHVIHLGSNKVPHHAKLYLCSRLGINYQNHILQLREEKRIAAELPQEITQINHEKIENDAQARILNTELLKMI